jgi:ABC-2 type transport system permease protein
MSHSTATLDHPPRSAAIQPATGITAFALASATLWQRELVRFFRQPSRVVGALGSPLLFWLLIGSGLGRSFRPTDAASAGSVTAGAHYLQYFFAGTLLLILLFTAIFSTISLIQDRREGFLQGVMVAPIPRGAIVMGKILGGTTLAVIQGLLFLALAPFAHIPIGPATGFLVAATSFLVAFALTGLGFLLAWPMESIQGFHAIMNLFLIPMWLLSGALFPASGASTWVRALMAINPLTYGLSLLRHALAPGIPSSPGVGLSLLVTIAFAVVTFTISWVLASRKRSTPL